MKDLRNSGLQCGNAMEEASTRWQPVCGPGRREEWGSEEMVQHSASGSSAKSKSKSNVVVDLVSFSDFCTPHMAHKWKKCGVVAIGIGGEDAEKERNHCFQLLFQCSTFGLRKYLQWQQVADRWGPVQIRSGGSDRFSHHFLAWPAMVGQKCTTNKMLR